MPRLPLAVLALPAVLLSGCASTRALSSWQLPLAQPHPVFHHLYVIALTPLDPVAIDLERALVARLRDQGIAATAARDQLAEADLRAPDRRERIADKVRAAGADGVLVVAYERTEEKQVYVPPTTTSVPVPVPPPLYGAYPAYIGYHYEVAVQPGYYSTSTEYYLRSTLYQVGQERPVWVARSATVDPDTVAAGVRSFTATLVHELDKAGALAH